MWLDQLLAELGHCGPQGRAALCFLTEQRVKVSLHDQPTAARWTAFGNIQLHPRYAKGASDAPYPLSLIVHEVQHLKQGVFTALSGFGELNAWQTQFSFLKSLTGCYHSDSQSNALITELMSLSLNGDRKVLIRALNLMRAYAGKGYRVNLLPLTPLPREILFFISRR